MTNLDDLADAERQSLIASVQPEPAVNWEQTAIRLADRLADCQEACLMAIHWADQGAFGRAREELLRVLKIK